MRSLMKKLLLALACLGPIAAIAEDIDLFLGANGTASSAPNVLIILDNTANWSSPFTNEMNALISVFNTLPENKFRVGMMLYSETGSPNSNTDGAYVRAAVRLLDANTKTKYAALINSFDKNNDKSNSGKSGKAMEEAYLYLTGGTPYGGNNKLKTDYLNNTSGNTASNAVYALPGNALGSQAGTTYNKPIADGTCAPVYIIYISNGAPQDSNADNTQALNALTAAGGDATTIPLNPAGSQDNAADEWARFMKKSALKATVYTIDINKVTTGQGPGWTAVLKSMADQTAGKYFDIVSSGTQIVDTLNEVFSEIQAVNSVFASVSLPLSVNTQGTYLNQVYVGMFRPDADAAPRWAGNLKQYKIGTTGTDLLLQDADSAAAINTSTGFVTECARSFWTPSMVDTEWTTRPQGDCLRVANSSASNYPDGNIVEKGAQAYRLRQDSARSVNTCSASSCTAAIAFNNTNITQAALGAGSTTERDALINWAIGQDVDDENRNTVTTTERRLSVHGDVVHSRPVAINLGTDVDPKVVVFYGGNDGWFRAVNGNRSTAIGSIAAGSEFWSFMPPEFVSKVKRIRDNSTLIKFQGSQIATALPKDYAMDGPITTYQGQVSGSPKSFVYATMRRGGRSIYAFDATNMLTTPTTASLKWRIGCPDATDASCTSGLTGIGQSWSSLKAMTTANYNSGTKPMMIFGGGYDTCEDYDALVAGGANNNCTTTSKGAYVYVVDADTGALVRAFDLANAVNGYGAGSPRRGVVADVTIARDSTGQAIYAYTTDLGGNVYRMNFSGASASDWTVTRIASLGCDTAATCTANRKFMFAPSVAQITGGYAVMVGSGDREKPLRAYTVTTGVTNNFFMFVDKPTELPATYPGSTDCGSTLICRASLLSIPDASTPTDAALAAKKGWYLGLASTEQVVTSAVTLFGTVTFSTQQPAVTSASACSSNLGTTLVYNINYANAKPVNGDVRYADVAGDGLPPSPVVGRVKLDNGQIVPFCIGCSPDSPLQAKNPPVTPGGAVPKRRTYWYIQK